MRKSTCLLALCLTFAIAAPLASGKNLQFTFKGLQAIAESDTTDPSGCIETFISLNSINGSIKQVGGPVMSSAMFMFVSEANNCTQTQLILAFGSTPLAPGAFQIDNALKSASLDATLELGDLVSNTSLPATVSLTWTGSGQPGGFELHENFRQPAFGLKTTTRDSGTFRSATATGSVTLSGVDLLSGTPIGGSLGSVKQGEVDVSH